VKERKREREKRKGLSSAQCPNSLINLQARDKGLVSSISGFYFVLEKKRWNEQCMRMGTGVSSQI